MIDKDGTIDKDVDLRMQAAWSIWRKLTGVLYDRTIPLRLKAKVYEAIIRPALTYGSECWAMTMTNKRNIATTDMRMFAVSSECRDENTWKRGNPTKTTRFTDRRGYAQWPSSLRRDADNVTRRMTELAIPCTIRGRRHGTNKSRTT